MNTFPAFSSSLIDPRAYVYLEKRFFASNQALSVAEGRIKYLEAALNDLAHEARKNGHHGSAAWIYAKLNGSGPDGEGDAKTR
jgi:hypothetical protein